MPRELSVGKIDHDSYEPYGDVLSYQLGAEWLAPCRLVEDWGCGRGFFRTVCTAQQYVGIDTGVDSVPGPNPFATVLVDLVHYSSTVDGIFMRHVLEHNWRWKIILEHAIASFTERMFLAVFTPLQLEQEPEEQAVLALHTKERYPCYEEPVPNLALKRSVIEGTFRRMGCKVRYERRVTGTQYGQEHLWYAEK